MSDDVRAQGGKLRWQLERGGGLERFSSFEAEMALLATEQGGRRAPISSGFRPVALLDGEMQEVAIYFDGPPVRPGERGLVRVIPMRIDFWRPLEVGERIDVAEAMGKRVIAELTVTSTDDLRR